MRFLLDTNILIPLEDFQIPLKDSLANFVRLARENSHQLVCHPASEDDIGRDTDEVRRQLTLDRLRQYPRLEDRPKCPWNDSSTLPNDAADNEILYALQCEAVHALVTEDRGIHKKAKQYGLGNRVYYIQAAETWLRQLHEIISVQLPYIEETSLYNLKPLLSSEFFDSLREGYKKFDDWFIDKARNGRKAWVSWEKPDTLGAVCIYARQTDETITEDGLKLEGAALKLSTFKVGPTVRGRKIGELLLKIAFRYATINRLENIFIHGDLEKHRFLYDLLEDFGFSNVGTHPGSGGRDAVYLKRHPISPPDVGGSAFDYLRNYFPLFMDGPNVAKYIVPIRPHFHEILFPEYRHPLGHQNRLFQPQNFAGNAIKQAYLCHAPIREIEPGSIVLFCRTQDHRAITSLGIVEEYQSRSDPSQIAQLVSRRTVYSMDDIRQMALKPTKVMLYRHVKDFKNPIDHEWLQTKKLLKGTTRTIRPIDDHIFKTIIDYAE